MVALGVSLIQISYRHLSTTIQFGILSRTAEGSVVRFKLEECRAIRQRSRHRERRVENPLCVSRVDQLDLLVPRFPPFLDPARNRHSAFQGILCPSLRSS